MQGWEVIKIGKGCMLNQTRKPISWSDTMICVLEWLNRPTKLQKLKTYTFLSKVFEESNKIFEDILAKKYMDGGNGSCNHINCKWWNWQQCGHRCQGIKKRDCSRSTKKTSQILGW